MYRKQLAEAKADLDDCSQLRRVNDSLQHQNEELRRKILDAEQELIDAKKEYAEELQRVRKEYFDQLLMLVNTQRNVNSYGDHERNPADRPDQSTSTAEG